MEGANLLDELAGRGRRHDVERLREAVAEALVRRKGGAAITHQRDAPDQLAVGRLGERIERGHPAGQVRGALELALFLRTRRGVGETLCETVPQLIATLEDPVVVEARQQFGRTALKRRLHLAGGQQLRDVVDIRADLGAEADAAVTLAAHHRAGSRAQRGPQLRERGPQAHARTGLTDVRPQPSSELATTVYAPLERQDRKQQPGLAAGRRQVGDRPVELHPEVAQEVQARHRRPAYARGGISRDCFRARFAPLSRTPASVASPSPNPKESACPPPFAPPFR